MGELLLERRTAWSCWTPGRTSCRRTGTAGSTPWSAATSGRCRTRTMPGAADSGAAALLAFRLEAWAQALRHALAAGDVGLAAPLLQRVVEADLVAGRLAKADALLPGAPQGRVGGHARPVAGRHRGAVTGGGRVGRGSRRGGSSPPRSGSQAKGLPAGCRWRLAPRPTRVVARLPGGPLASAALLTAGATAGRRSARGGACAGLGAAAQAISCSRLPLGARRRRMRGSYRHPVVCPLCRIPRYRLGHPGAPAEPTGGLSPSPWPLPL